MARLPRTNSFSSNYPLIPQSPTTAFPPFSASKLERYSFPNWRWAGVGEVKPANSEPPRTFRNSRPKRQSGNHNNRVSSLPPLQIGEVFLGKSLNHAPILKSPTIAFPPFPVLRRAHLHHKGNPSLEPSPRNLIDFSH